MLVNTTYAPSVSVIFMSNIQVSPNSAGMFTVTVDPFSNKSFGRISLPQLFDSAGDTKISLSVNPVLLTT